MASGQSGDWYARKMYVPGTTAYKNHLKNFGHPSESGYKEVLRDWNPSKLDPAALTGSYGAEQSSMWALLLVSTANVVLGVWRPRITRIRS